MSLIKFLLSELQVQTITKKIKINSDGVEETVNQLSAFDESTFLNTYPQSEILKIEKAIKNGVRPEVNELLEKSKRFVPSIFMNDTFRFYKRKDSLYFYSVYYIFDDKDTITNKVTSNFRISNHANKSTSLKTMDDEYTKINFFINEYDSSQEKIQKIKEYVDKLKKE